MLIEPLRFKNYDRMQFIYDSFLEIVEDDVFVRRLPIYGLQVWHAFHGYFQQRRQRGDDHKLLKCRLIRVMGGSSQVESLKRRYKSYSGKPWYWLSPFPSWTERLRSQNPTNCVDASTQVEKNDGVAVQTDC